MQTGAVSGDGGPLTRLPTHPPAAAPSLMVAGLQRAFETGHKGAQLLLFSDKWAKKRGKEIHKCAGFTERGGTK